MRYLVREETEEMENLPSCWMGQLLGTQRRRRQEGREAICLERSRFRVLVGGGGLQERADREISRESCPNDLL